MHKFQNKHMLSSPAKRSHLQKIKDINVKKKKKNVQRR